MGMFAQIFILPSVDSIVGFTFLLLVVSFTAAWFISSGPRLSYFGVQLAYAYFIVNVSDFKIQTSLRDSVRDSDSVEAQRALTGNLKTFLPLSERITDLAVSLGKEI